MNIESEHISHDLLMAFLSGEADENQIKEVGRWLDKSPENKAYLDQLEKVWIETGKIKPAPVVVDVDAAWKKVSEKMMVDLSEKTFNINSGRQRTKTFYYISIAAVIALLVGAYFILQVYSEANEVEYYSHEKIIEKELPDGTNISLNANSSIKYAENKNENTRDCFLKGEAFFDVKRNVEKPFVIHADVTKIEVVGTSFNVSAGDDSDIISVFVKTGKVLFYKVNEESNDTMSVILQKGERGEYNKDTGKLDKMTSGSENDLFWLEKTLFFEETRLSKVIEILKAAYQVDILAGNENISDCRYSGSFSNESIDMILEVISESFNLTVRKENNTYILDGEGC